MRASCNRPSLLPSSLLGWVGQLSALRCCWGHSLAIFFLPHFPSQVLDPYPSLKVFTTQTFTDIAPTLPLISPSSWCLLPRVLPKYLHSKGTINGTLTCSYYFSCLRETCGPTGQGNPSEKYTGCPFSVSSAVIGRDEYSAQGPCSVDPGSGG